MKRRHTRRSKLSILALSLLATGVLLLLIVQNLRSGAGIDGAKRYSSAIKQSRSRVVRSAASNYTNAARTLSGVRPRGRDDENASIISGYLSSGRGFNLEFHPYGEEEDIDLRVIVFAYNRPASLNICLTALEEADYNGDRVGVHVWLDRSDADDLVDAETLQVAERFNFSRGAYAVHVHDEHVGVQGQWMNTWRPDPKTKEIALLLEDDITVSPFFWRWLKKAHAAYAGLDEISGFSISHPEMEHQNGGLLEVSANDTIFMYPVICTWGFSPQPRNWRSFQDWFLKVEQDADFLPVVEGILPTDWFLSERRVGKERTLWEQWHIYYTHMKHQYTVMLNPGRRGLLAVNRHERGLHDGHVVVGATQPLCPEWSPVMDKFPPKLPRYGYDGLLES